MLNEKDHDWLIEVLVATAETLGTDIRPLAASMMADDLASYGRPVLAAALARVRSEAPTRLTLKAVIDAIDALAGRPGANEAWAVALSALDERNTVVWTGEMAQAWAVALPIAQEGDLIGARMAFKDAYERLVRNARELRLLPEVTVSEGWDNAGRAVAVEKAVALGYMTPDAATAYLPAPVTPGYSPVLLLHGMPSAALPPSIRERLLQLRADIATSDKSRRETAARDAIEAQQELAAKKAEAQRLADEYLFAQDAEFRQRSAA